MSRIQKIVFYPVSFFCIAMLVVAAGIGAVFALRAVQAAQTPPAGHYFAPYVDMSAWPTPLLAQMARSTGLTHFTLAFILDAGHCSASWGGVTSLNNDGGIGNDIADVRNLGGDVIVAFGGEAGIELAQDCPTVSSLQAQYQAVITRYHLTHIDFDIEGAAIADPPSINLRNKALAALEKANSGLLVSYTLPVLPTGLTNDGFNLLKNAQASGVTINVVNVMAMDYGSVAPPNRMGQNAIEAAQSLYNQLQDLYPAKSATQLWAMVGVTPMIGMNDVDPEVFTQQDARALLSFAVQHHLTELSFWSLGRDKQCIGGNYVAPDCSGVSQQPLAFTQIFKTFTSGDELNPTPSSVPSTPTPQTTAITTPPAPIPQASSSPVGNLLQNAGFETGTTADWQCDARATVAQQPVHSGRYALQLAASPLDTAQCSQTVRVQPNHTYVLHAYVSGHFAFLGTSLDDDQAWVDHVGYSLLSMTFTTDAHTTSVSILVHGWFGMGTVFADDVSLAEVSM